MLTDNKKKDKYTNQGLVRLGKDNPSYILKNPQKKLMSGRIKQW